MYTYKKTVGISNKYKISLVNSENLDEIQNLCRKCSDYYLLDKGTFEDKNEAKSILESLPEGKSYDDQYNFGIFNKFNKLIGLVHIIKDYPQNNVWMLGLILIDPKERNCGLGGLIHKEILAFVKEGNGEEIRIGVLEENKIALGFWNSLGYKLKNVVEMERANNIVKNILTFTYSI